MNKSAHTEKNIFFLLIIVIAFVIFLVFYSNKDVIVDNGQTQMFVIISALGLGLLSYFVYLISNRSSSNKKRR